MSQERSPNKRTTGRLIATLLAGSCRGSSAAPNLSAAELAQIAPLLMRSGAGATAWWQIRETDLAESDAGAGLRQVYRLDRLRAALHVQKIKRFISLFRDAGIEPVLIKGWAVARAYPERGLRHYRDVDLCVAPDRYQAANELLESLGDERVYVDLHDGLRKFDTPRKSDGRQQAFRVQALACRLGLIKDPTKVGTLNTCSWNEIFQRSQLVQLDDVEVRVLSAADHLRVLCLHWLRDGAWRPSGLCDIAIALESRPADFDWQSCLGADSKQADWIACALGLAQHLLGARIDDTPVAARASNLPRWLLPAVMRQWDRCLGSDDVQMILPELFKNLFRPAALWRELYPRWDRPLLATVSVNGPFNNLPRLPYQLLDLVLRFAKLPAQLAYMLRKSLRVWSLGSRVMTKSRDSQLETLELS
jgi:hypothetical protein